MGHFKSRPHLSREAGSPQLVRTARWRVSFAATVTTSLPGRAYRRCGHAGLTTRMGRNCRLGRGGQRPGGHRPLFCIPSSRVESPGQKLSGPCAHPGLATGNCLSLAIWDGGDIRRDGASAACAQTSPVGGRWNLPPAGSRRPLGKFLWQAHQVHLVCLSRPAVSWGSFNAWRIAVTHPTPHRERG